jgi:hypothetical protein
MPASLGRPLLCPVALKLVPGLLRGRGVAGVTVQRLHQALAAGLIPGRREGDRWLVDEGDLDAVGRHFGGCRARPEPPRKGAAGLAQARARAMAGRRGDRPS